jgi:glycosyltransferase involved in cell wall biosynthesis
VDACALKVLVVTPHIFEGGAEKAVLNLVYHLNSMDCDASIATLSVDLRKLPSHFSKVKFVLPENPIGQPVMKSITSVATSSLREITSFVKLLRTHARDFDLVCPCNFPTYWATYIARTKKPVIWLSSEVLSPVNQTRDLYDRSPLFRAALKFAITLDKHIVNSGVDPIVTCSQYNSKLIKERYGRESIVIHTGVDYEFFNAATSQGKAYFSMNNEGTLLLQVGALMQRKNQIVSIRALKILKEHLSSVKLALVGEGPWKTILQKEVNRLGLEKDVFFMGSISENELRSLYQTCDVNLFPVTDQTWGLVPFEALAAGKPSIVADGCGAAEVIGKEKIAFLIEPTAEKLAGAVMFALKNTQISEGMVKRGQQYVRDNLTWDKYALNMYKIFENVIRRA